MEFFSLAVMPWQEPHLAPIFVNQQVITQRHHTVVNRHKLFTGTKKSECLGQALEIPWKLCLMNDKQIAKTLPYFWEVPDPITAPSQEIASSLGRAVMLPLVFALWLDESSFLAKL